MNTTEQIIKGLEMAQICWVVPDIEAGMKFLSGSLGTPVFAGPQHVRAQDLDMTYYGKVVAADWLTTQVYNGSTFIELVQPLTGQSMFHDYLTKNNGRGGIQHIAYRVPEADFDVVVKHLSTQGLATISTVDHPIARMRFFDTYELLGVATEIMGITQQGYAAITQMQQKS